MRRYLQWVCYSNKEWQHNIIIVFVQSTDLLVHTGWECCVFISVCLTIMVLVKMGTGRNSSRGTKGHDTNCSPKKINGTVETSNIVTLHILVLQRKFGKQRNKDSNKERKQKTKWTFGKQRNKDSNKERKQKTKWTFGKQRNKDSNKERKQKTKHQKERQKRKEKKSATEKNERQETNKQQQQQQNPITKKKNLRSSSSKQQIAEAYLKASNLLLSTLRVSFCMLHRPWLQVFFSLNVEIQRFRSYYKNR